MNKTPNQSNLILTNVSIRPKPANLTIQSPSTNQQTTDKQPQYQIIRLVSATGNTSNTTNSTITTTGLKQITGTQAGQQKVLIPASALKGLNATQLLNPVGNASGAGQQFLKGKAAPHLLHLNFSSANHIIFTKFF